MIMARTVNSDPISATDPVQDVPQKRWGDLCWRDGVSPK